MIEGKFNIVFSGKMAPGRSENDVKQALAALFKSKPEQIERLFSGNQVTIKKGLEYAQAMKYQAALKKAGALALLQKVKPEGSEKHTQEKVIQQKAASPVAVAPTPLEKQADAEPTLSSTKANFTGTKADFSSSKADFSGGMTADEKAAGNPENVSEEAESDASGLSVAAAGERIPGFDKPTPTNVPEAGSYELGKEGEPILETSQHETREVDTTAFSLASAGEPIPNEETHTNPLNPDTSHLTIK